MPAPAHLGHGVHLGALKQKDRAGIACAAGLQAVQGLHRLHGQVLGGDGHVHLQHRGQGLAVAALRHRPAQGQRQGGNIFFLYGKAGG